jgi:hypothetical protein
MYRESGMWSFLCGCAAEPLSVYDSAYGAGSVLNTRTHFQIDLNSGTVTCPTGKPFRYERSRRTHRPVPPRMPVLPAR